MRPAAALLAAVVLAAAALPARPASAAGTATEPGTAAHLGVATTAPAPDAGALRLACPAVAAGVDALAVPAGLTVPGPSPAVADPVRAVALQHYQAMGDVTDFASFRAKLDCEMSGLVLPRLRAGEAAVVSLNELTGLIVFATGERGTAARQLAATPAGRGAGDAGGVPTAAAIGLLATGSAYATALAYYHLPAAGSAAFSVHDLFTAATDTLVRGFVIALRDAAAKYSALAGGPVWMVGSAPMPVRWHAELRAATSATQYLADCLTLYADPSQCATSPPDRLYIADEHAVYNVAFVVGPHPADADRPFIGVQRKVNLTALEGPSLLDLTPGRMRDVQPVAIPGTAARLGIAISLDAFEHARPCSARTATYLACLDSRGANVMVQPEANDALEPAASWADYIDTSSDSTGGRNPQWQPLTWMESAWRSTADPAYHFRYAINSFMTGNLLDIAFDGQSAIFARDAAACGHYVGDGRFLGPYPSGGPDEVQWAGDAGDKPQFLALAPWVLADGPRTLLRARARAMSPNSGSAFENDYRETAVAADMELSRRLGTPGACPGGVATGGSPSPTATATPPATAGGLPGTGTAVVTAATGAPCAAVLLLAATAGHRRRRRRLQDRHHIGRPHNQRARALSRSGRGPWADPEGVTGGAAPVGREGATISRETAWT